MIEAGRQPWNDAELREHVTKAGLTALVAWCLWKLGIDRGDDRMRALRGIRGLLGITLAWSIAWIPLGALVGIAEGVIWRDGFVFPDIVESAPLLATVGAVCGFTFALLLAAMERGRAVETLPMPRVVAWGVAASLVIPVLALLMGGAGSSFAGGLWSLSMFGIPGAACATATFALARRGDRTLEGADAS